MLSLVFSPRRPFKASTIQPAFANLKQPLRETGQIGGEGEEIDPNTKKFRDPLVPVPRESSPVQSKTWTFLVIDLPIVPDVPVATTHSTKL